MTDSTPPRGPIIARRRLLVLAPLAGLSLAAAPSQAPRYTIDPRFGSITFTAHHMGLFSSSGRFRQFDADLEIDPDHLEQTRIAVEVSAASVDMAWDDGAPMLRSPAFFDVARHPLTRFTSTDAAALGPGTYVLRGKLEIRGVTQPLTLTATLVGRETAGDRGGESADFVVNGALSRAAYGMVTERTFISDTIDITITARIRLAEPAHAG